MSVSPSVMEIVERLPLLSPNGELQFVPYEDYEARLMYDFKEDVCMSWAFASQINSGDHCLVVQFEPLSPELCCY
jgi:hypothetical protein